MSDPMALVALTAPLPDTRGAFTRAPAAPFGASTRMQAPVRHCLQSVEGVARAIAEAALGARIVISLWDLGWCP